MAPPIREGDVDDGQDAERVAMVRKRWEDLDAVYFGINRTVEEHVRMLSGRQWDVWSDILGRFVDPLRYMTDDERRWRQRPVMDYLGYWFMVTLSKVTENLPLVGFVPSNMDDKSAMLAEVMDPLFKQQWDEVEMPERYMAVAAWALAGGESYLISRADYEEGDEQELIGPAVLRLERDGQEPIERSVDAVPLDENGDPRAELMEDPDQPGEYGYDVTGDPHTQRKGKLKVDVGSTLEIRAQWGTHIPWRDKEWIIHRWFLSPDQVWLQHGVECEPDTFADSNEAAPGYIERMLFGAGHFGAARQEIGAQPTATANREGYVSGMTMWEKPSRQFPKSPENPNGGRLLIVTADKVLADSGRPYDTECAGPIRKVAFMPIPGRPIGSTPLEKMVPFQKRLNRIEAQVAEHTNLSTNPILFMHMDANVDMEEFVARPGLIVEHEMPEGHVPGVWLAPPPISEDVWRHKTDVKNQLFTIGSIDGNDSAGPGGDPSGELIQQLRYNADRPLSPLTRSLELAAAGVAEDWMAILPTIMTDEEIIHVVGEDNIVRTLTVLPEMWEGKVACRPIMESAAPETREKRQERIGQLYQMGLFDPEGAMPMTSAAGKRRFLELSRYPELTRAAKPGGVHQRTAERFLGELMRGGTAQELPLLEVYELDVHAQVLEEFMASIDYLNQSPAIQEQMEIRRQDLQDAAMAKQIKDMETEGQVADVMGAVQAKIAANNPAAAPGAGPAGGPPASSAPAAAPPGAGQAA